ncbi:MAG: hypothetical protein IPM82_03210 [Saprospiraceae bacterium]|nr:hypothetical protein [Saprospiraceae bacterium]
MVNTPPDCTVRVDAAAPAALIIGSFATLGMITTVGAEGTPAGDQFEAVFQSVLVAPVQFF